MAERQLHVERRSGVERCDVQVGIEDLDLAVALDVAGLDLAGTGGLDEDRLGALRVVELGDQALDVEDDLRHILLDAGDGGELMLHTGDLDGGSCGAGERREHNAAQGVAQRNAVSTLQRLDNVLAVRAVCGVFDTLDLGLFNFNHAVTLLHLLIAVAHCCAPPAIPIIIEGILRLLGVQLNDEVLLNRNVDLLAGGKTSDGALESILLALHPHGLQEHGRVLTQQALEALGGAAALCDLDHIAGLDEVGRNVDLLAVDGEVGVADELTGLTAGHRKAHAIDDVVQTALDGDEQVVTGLAGSRSGLLIVIMELLFQDTVDELDLLLLSKLDDILALFSLHLAAGVAVRGLLRITHNGRRNA